MDRGDIYRVDLDPASGFELGVWTSGSDPLGMASLLSLSSGQGV